MIDLRPWKCVCGVSFVDTHHAITVEMPAHSVLDSAHVIRKPEQIPSPVRGARPGVR